MDRKAIEKPVLILIGLMLILVGGGSSCETLPDVAGAKAKQQTLREVLDRVQTNMAGIARTQEQLVASESNRTAIVETKMQSAADNVHSARAFNLANTNINAFTTNIEAHLEIAQLTLGEPSLERKRDTGEIVRTGTSGAAADVAASSKRLADDRARALRLNVELEAAKQQVELAHSQLARQKSDLEENVRQLEQKELALKEAAKKAEEEKKLAEAKEGQNRRLKIAAAFMIVGGAIVAAGFAALYFGASMVMGPCLIGGGSLLGIGLLITMLDQLFQQPWFQWTVGGVCVLILVVLGWLAFQAFHTKQDQKLSSTISENTLGAIAEFKEKNPESYAALRPLLEEWHTTADGFPDGKVHKEIDRRLQKMNLKPVKPAQTPRRAGQHPPATPPPAPPGLQPPGAGAPVLGK